LLTSSHLFRLNGPGGGAVPRERPVPSKRRWILATLAVLLAAGTASAAYLWWPREPGPVGSPILPDTPAKRVSSLPDIVVITLDTTRADHLGLYGYPRNTSPNLDRLGKESLVFEDFQTPEATTLPAHTSLFTSLFPEEHGIVANAHFLGRRFVPPEGASTFASWLAMEGYRTTAFVSASPVKRGSGIERGFENFSQPSRRTRKADETTEHALEWLARGGRDPVFIWIHYFDPHAPYTPPRAWRRLFGTDDPLRALMAMQEIDPDMASKINLYDGEIRFMDACLGWFLDELRRAGRWEHTVVVVAGDHGEGLKEHKRRGHGMVWNEQLHVPLVIHVPGLAPRRIPGVIATVDVVPTLLGLLDLPKEDEFLEQASGVDVLSAARTEPVLSRTSLRKSNPKSGKVRAAPSTFAMTGPRWKYFLTEEGGELLFDRSTDPLELSDMSGLNPELAAAARSELLDTLDRQRARAAALGAGKTEPLPPEMLRELQALGYLDADGNGGME
jgi:arylsulfatase A-like enzyme